MIIAVAAVIVVDRFVRRIRPNEAKDEGSVRPNDYSIDSPAGEAAGEDSGVTVVVEVDPDTREGTETGASNRV